MTLVFHAAGKVDVRRQDENSEAMSEQRTGLP
jgi:hypothetical protein